MTELTARLLTAPATGAIAVLELRGDADALQRLLAAHLDREVSGRPGHAAHRWWRDANGRPLDDGLVVVRADDCAELHLHGGRGVLAAVVESLRAAGVSVPDGGDAGWPTTPQYADDWRGAVERALAHARTARLAKLLLGQPEVIPDWLWRARDAVQYDDTEAAAEALAELRSGGRLARFVEDAPPNIVLAGRPNAGKSTLFNALLGGDRALVSPHAGTTRDTVEAVIAVRGLPVQLVDTAGLTERALADDRLERRGQVRSLRALRGADLVLHVVDATEAEPPRVEYETDVPVVRVETKADLLEGDIEDASGVESRGRQPVGVGGETSEGGQTGESLRSVRVSAVRDLDLRPLLDAVADGLQLPDDESIVPVPLGRLRQRLQMALAEAAPEGASAPDPLRALALLLPEAEW